MALASSIKRVNERYNRFRRATEPSFKFRAILFIDNMIDTATLEKGKDATANRQNKFRQATKPVSRFHAILSKKYTKIRLLEIDSIKLSIGKSSTPNEFRHSTKLLRFNFLQILRLRC